MAAEVSPQWQEHFAKEDPQRIPPSVRQAVLDRDNSQCQICGTGGDNRLQLHHLTYRSHGGRHIPENLVTVCHRCHEAVHRGDTDLLLLEISPGKWASFPLTPHYRSRSS